MDTHGSFRHVEASAETAMEATSMEVHEGFRGSVRGNFHGSYSHGSPQKLLLLGSCRGQASVETSI